MNKFLKLFLSSVKKVLVCGFEMNISTVNRFWVYLVFFKIMKEIVYFLKKFFSRFNFKEKLLKYFWLYSWRN